MSSRSKYDWEAIAAFYSRGHTPTECQREYGISNGAWHAAVQRGDVVLRSPGHDKARGRTRAAVARLLAQGTSQAAIARQLGISKPTVCFHVRMLGIPARPAPANRYDWDKISAFYEAGGSATECRLQFGFSRNAWADAIKRGVIVPRPRAEPIDGVLAAGRPRSRQHVKSRMLLAGLKSPQCERCGLGEWLGQALSLELHHVNGDGQDNRLENLRLLCPNCHSQTDTWGGRNKAHRAAVGPAR